MSYREGDFTLASGKKSTFYIDLKMTTLDPIGAHLVGRLGVLACEPIIQNDAKSPLFVGGLTLGADPIATALSMAALERGYFLPACIVRKETKDHGTSKVVEGVTPDLKGVKKCLVVEDVVTTGGSALQAVEKLRANGFVVDTVLTIVDRLQGGLEIFQKQGLVLKTLLTIDDVRSN